MRELSSAPTLLPAGRLPITKSGRQWSLSYRTHVPRWRPGGGDGVGSRTLTCSCSLCAQQASSPYIISQNSKVKNISIPPVSKQRSRTPPSGSRHRKALIQPEVVDIFHTERSDPPVVDCHQRLYKNFGTKMNTGNFRMSFSLHQEGKR